MSRIKRDFLVISFDNTTASMACESLCQREGLPGTMISLPNQISAGCGLAWRALPEERDELVAALDREGVAWVGADVVQLWDLVGE